MAVIAQGYILVVVGAVLDRKPYARQLEYLRLFLLTSMLYGSFSIGLLSVDWLYYGVAYLAASTALIWVCVKSESMGETVASSDLA